MTMRCIHILLSLFKNNKYIQYINVYKNDIPTTHTCFNAH